jgi:photosystem II stability/assembly factor-like uncharacterized protein
LGGGEGGELFRSTDDGLHWNEVPAMNGAERLKTSITAIETRGARVEVRARFGRWLSLDGGVSWQKMAE